MAAITTLVPDVLAEIPGIPSFVAERQLLRAIRVFCEETLAWRVNIQISTVDTESTVDLETLLPASTELVDVVTMKNNGGGEPVHPRTYSWLDTNTSDWRSETDIAAKWYIRDGNNILRLVPTPASTSTELYTTRLAVKPLLTATVIDDLLINKFNEEFIHGALAYLYLIPRKPWTDPGMGQYHLLLFQDSFSSARVAAAEEFETGVARKVKYGGI